MTSNARLLLICGLTVVLAMLMVLLTVGFGCLVWRWEPPARSFQVTSFSWE